MEFNLLMGEQAGQALAPIENQLAELLNGLGYTFFATRNYMSRIRGGHNYHMFRISENPVNALSGGKWDMIIALDRKSEKRHRATLKKDGIFLSPQRVKEIGKTAGKRHGATVAGNTIMAGIVLAALGCGPEDMDRTGRQSADIAALKTGISLASAWGMSGKIRLKPGAGKHFKFDGNQALAFGAILGGCQFMAGYPMTPSTSIMTYFSDAARQLPIRFEQAEDEIAAINLAIEASHAGLRSMVATSAGGFALMQESVALAGMTETPVVIIIGQRPARSTGLRPRIGPGEIDFTLHSGHGEFPRVLLAPGSIDEAICLARRSFELADRHQIPVFILTDQYFADSIQITEGSIAPESKSREYRSRGPDCLTHPGPGAAPVKAASGEHDEEGKIPKDPELRIRMLNKRLGKSEKIRGEALLPGFYGDGDAEDILICWGSNKLIVKEAIERLRADGIRIGALHFSQVYPLVPEMTRDYDLGEKRLICIENDATGQFAGLLKRELGLEVEDHILKYNGECFTVEEVCREARKRIISRGQKTLA